MRLRTAHIVALFACAAALSTTTTLAEDPPAEKATATAPAKDTPVAETKGKSATKKPALPPQVLKLAKGKLQLPVPGKWKTVKPRSRIIAHEYSIPKAKGDDTAGRMTLMAASGGIDANIQRWVGQFKTADGKPLGEEAKKVEKKNIGDLEVHVVDLTGDFQDSPRGPFGPKVNRPGYRMLAAIIPLKQGGTWFIKFYGPKNTVKAAEKQFHTMITGIKHTP